MRIAICFYGLFRSFEKTYKLTIKNFDLTKHDFDVFIYTSTYSNKKYRFKKVGEEKIDKKILIDKINSIVGDNLKQLHIIDENPEKIINRNRVDKYIGSLQQFLNYKKNNNVSYDFVVQHRMDVIFVPWSTADNYYELRKIGEKREKGLLTNDKFDFPIGVKNHGCCCIQACPNIDEVLTLKINKLNSNEIYCYEDFHIGHNVVDFLICNDNIDFIEKQIQFWTNYKNGHLLTNNKYIKFNNLNSIQSYDYLDNEWINYMWSDNLYYQFSLFLKQNNIIHKCLRYTQDCGQLYIR